MRRGSSNFYRIILMRNFWSYPARFTAIVLFYITLFLPATEIHCSDCGPKDRLLCQIMLLRVDRERLPRPTLHNIPERNGLAYRTVSAPTVVWHLSEVNKMLLSLCKIQYNLCLYTLAFLQAQTSLIEDPKGFSILTLILQRNPKIIRIAVRSPELPLPKKPLIRELLAKL